MSGRCVILTPASLPHGFEAGGQHSPVLQWLLVMQLGRGLVERASKGAVVCGAACSFPAISSDRGGVPAPRGGCASAFTKGLPML